MTAEAAPSWTGIGAGYAAWVRALRRDPANPEAAIDKDAPKRAYLAFINGAKHLLVLYHLYRWKAPNGGHSHLNRCIVAFKGEVQDAHGLPLLWKFDKEEEVLLQLCQLPASVLHHASMFYHDGDKEDQFHNRRTPPPPEWRGETLETCHHLIPIPVGWAPMFLDYPSMGTAFRRMIQLMLTAEAAERRHLWPFCEGAALACGSSDLLAINPISTLNSKWKQVAFTKASLSLATTAWEGHRPASRKAPLPCKSYWLTAILTNYLAGRRRRRTVIKPGATVGGSAGPTPLPRGRPMGPNLVGSTTHAITSGTCASHSSSGP
jgi:hypothetical protein